MFTFSWTSEASFTPNPVCYVHKRIEAHTFRDTLLSRKPGASRVRGTARGGAAGRRAGTGEHCFRQRPRKSQLQKSKSAPLASRKVGRPESPTPRLPSHHARPPSAMAPSADRPVLFASVTHTSVPFPNLPFH